MAERVPTTYVGRKRKTVYETASKKRRLDNQRAKTRVNVGVAFQRWRRLMEEQGLKNDAMVAEFLLDRETSMSCSFKYHTTHPKLCMINVCRAS
uniref:Uncharacterized protein n=1 Tax=Scophthalmus maximus TaxID=52904 RepID=A0A8D3DP46_SCOMX